MCVILKSVQTDCIWYISSYCWRSSGLFVLRLDHHSTRLPLATAFATAAATNWISLGSCLNWRLLLWLRLDRYLATVIHRQSCQFGYSLIVCLIYHQKSKQIAKICIAPSVVGIDVLADSVLVGLIFPYQKLTKWCFFFGGGQVCYHGVTLCMLCKVTSNFDDHSKRIYQK